MPIHNHKIRKAFGQTAVALAAAFSLALPLAGQASNSKPVKWRASDGHYLKDDWLYKYGNNYYFDANGDRVTNQAKTIDGTTYFFDKNGVMLKNGFSSRDGSLYFYDSTGQQVSNYFYNNWGKTYYFGKDGKRYTNQFYQNWGHTYYFGNDGARYTNQFLSYQGHTYYFDSQGIMYQNQFYTNWGHTYYFGANGALVTSQNITVNGVKYHADAQGILTQLNGRTYGGDYSKYQPSLYNNTGQDSFAISQIGGSENDYIYTQPTYYSHAQQAKARGWRFHTYVWDQTGSNQYQTQAMLNYFLPRLSQPKGAIVALDYEAGASYNVEANTNNIIYGMQMIRNAGYTPMLYSYRPYLLAHVDVNRVLAAFPNSIWVAGYQNGLSTMPNYGAFPSMNGVAIWQYSDYGGQQDLNVDLTGITFNGYR